MFVEAILAPSSWNAPASEGELRRLRQLLSWELPSDYVAFLRRHDGGEGHAGEHCIVLWKAEELIRFNEEYEVQRYAPGLFLFGSNGGGESYGFDARSSALPVVRTPFIGMDLRYASIVADTFTDMIRRLSGLSNDRPRSTS